MINKKPNLFIVGAPKCGTSFLYEYLSKHSQIFMCPVKEPNYFDKDLHYTSKRLSQDEYLQLFSKVSSEKVIGEASIFYLYSTVAAREIYKFNPEARIIIMLRNPVDMMYSLHGEHLFQGNEIEEDFEKAISLEEERKEGRGVYKHTNPREGVYYKDIASYTNQIKRYQDLFGKEKVMVVLLDDFKSNPDKTFKSILNFLNVGSDFNIDLQVVNRRKKVKSKSLRELIKRPPGFLRKFIKVLLPFHSLRIYFQEKIMSLNSGEVEKEAIDPKLKRRLKNEMASEVEALSALLEKDLSNWK